MGHYAFKCLELFAVNFFKFFGVILVNSLLFKDHYRILYGKLLRSSFVIRKLSQHISMTYLKYLHFPYSFTYYLLHSYLASLC